MAEYSARLSSAAGGGKAAADAATAGREMSEWGLGAVFEMRDEAAAALRANLAPVVKLLVNQVRGSFLLLLSRGVTDKCPPPPPLLSLSTPPLCALRPPFRAE